MAVGVACAVVTLAVAALLSWGNDSLPGATQSLVLVLCVVAASTTGLRSAGLVASLAAAIGFDYFLTPPYFSLSISDPEDVQVTVLLLLIGLAVIGLAQWGRRHQAARSTEAAFLDGILQASMLAASRGTEDLSLERFLAAQITDVLGCDGARFESTYVATARTARISPDGLVSLDGRSVDVDADGLPTHCEIVTPVSPGVTPGGPCFVLTAATQVTRPTARRRRVAAALAAQLHNAV